MSQTSQSFWGQKFSSSPCSPGTAGINILTSVNPLFPFSPGLYQLWEGGMGEEGVERAIVPSLGNDLELLCKSSFEDPGNWGRALAASSVGGEL